MKVWVLNKVHTHANVCTVPGGTRRWTRDEGMRCSRSDRVKGRREEGEESLPPHPRLLRALPTGGAWLVMSREVTRLAGNNRLPPLIVYDVRIPPPPHTSISLIIPPSLSFHPSLPVFYGEFMIYPVTWRSGPQRAAEYFTAPDVSNAPLTLFLLYILPGPPRTDSLIHLEGHVRSNAFCSILSMAWNPTPQKYNHLRFDRLSMRSGNISIH